MIIILKKIPQKINLTKLIDTLQEVLEYFYTKVPERSLVSCFLDRVNLNTPHLFTCGVGKNYLIIDHRGDISLCQQEMSHPVSSIKENNPMNQVLIIEAMFKMFLYLKKRRVKLVRGDTGVQGDALL